MRASSVVSVIARMTSVVSLFGAIFVSATSMARPIPLTPNPESWKPIVDGNTIYLQLADSGWYYQVQDAVTYETICEGTSICLVDPGTYIVINHNYGFRYDDVVVGGSDPLMIDANTIHWPDDGWYQVQNAETYESLCEGGTSCTVTPGAYIVINHTTGQRYEDVLIEASDGSSVGAVAVDGNTIRWPDDGWYQVQNAETYESLCEGGMSCTVEPGTYNVINLTTGERFTGVEVSGVDTGSVTVDGNTIRWPDDGWYQVQNAETYESLCEGGTYCTVGPGIYNVINLTSGERTEFLSVAGVSDSEPDTGTEAVNTARFMGKPWREMAELATSALSISNFQSLNELVETTASSLGVGETSASTAESSSACTDGGDMSWRLETGFSTIGRGILAVKFYQFNHCSMRDREFSGTYTSTFEDGSVQYNYDSRRIQEYDLTIASGDDGVIRIEGTVEESMSRGLSFYCGTSEYDTTQSASFVSLNTGPLLDGYAIDSLSIDLTTTDTTSGLPSLDNCATVTSGQAQDSARIKLNGVDASLVDISRVGVFAIDDPVDANSGEVMDATLSIRPVREGSDNLTIRSTGAGRTVVVTVEEAGSVVSFETTWDFLK